MFRFVAWALHGEILSLGWPSRRASTCPMAWILSALIARMTRSWLKPPYHGPAPMALGHWRLAGHRRGVDDGDRCGSLHPNRFGTAVADTVDRTPSRPTPSRLTPSRPTSSRPTPGRRALVVLVAQAAGGAVATAVLLHLAKLHPDRGYGLLALAVAAVTAACVVVGVRHAMPSRSPAPSRDGLPDEGAPGELAPTEVPAPVTSAGKGLTAGGIAIGLATLIIVLGALTIRSGLIFGLVVLAVVFIPLEKVFALRPQKVLRAGWKTDVVHFGVNNILANAALIVPVVVVGLGLRALVPAGVHRAVAGQATWAQFLEAFLLAEIGGYIGHRAAHKVPLLWRFHKVHHSIQEMDWLAAAHLHPLDSVWTRSCIVLPLFVMGFSRATFGGFLAFTTFQAIFIHANVRLTFGPLRWVIATPEFHHWHHANDPDAYNSNFAGEFPLIDALFGTIYLPKGTMPARYGIDDQQPEGYLRQLAWPFRHAA
jgi:sterol desaturase/sphingolipid hydroxylase (fatty acid hydroxylase superfamily)